MSTPRWMNSLVRARQSKEDAARHSLAFARKAAKAAHDKARREADALAAKQAQQAERNVDAFVAAAASLQSAAAAHAVAVGAAAHADAWTVQREVVVTDAAIGRLTAEQLCERARLTAARRAEQLAQRETDETALAVFRRRSAARTEQP